MATIRILGVDPGLARMGWGIVEISGTTLRHVGHGILRSDAKNDLGRRLHALHDGIAAVIATNVPQAMAIEQAFVHRDPAAALKLGHARAVALLAAARADLEIAEYAPNHVKKCVVGSGHADKAQMLAMVRRLLPMADVSETDAADALACAIAHGHLSSTRARIALSLA